MHASHPYSDRRRLAQHEQAGGDEDPHGHHDLVRIWEAPLRGGGHHRRECPLAVGLRGGAICITTSRIGDKARVQQQRLFTGIMAI